MACRRTTQLQGFHYGTTLPDGSLLRADYPKIHTQPAIYLPELQRRGHRGAAAGSAAPTPELAALATVAERSLAFFDSKMGGETNSPGIGRRGVESPK
jgi:hypothetical protein